MFEYLKEIIKGHLDDLEMADIRDEVEDLMNDDDESDFNPEEFETLFRKAIDHAQDSLEKFNV